MWRSSKKSYRFWPSQNDMNQDNKITKLELYIEFM